MPFDQVDLTAEQCRKLLLHVQEIANAQSLLILKRGQHVDIAVLVEVVAQDRAEQLEPHDLPLPAELGDLFRRGAKVRRNPSHLSDCNIAARRSCSQPMPQLTSAAPTNRERTGATPWRRKTS